MNKIINLDLVPNFEEDDVEIIKKLNFYPESAIKKSKEEVLQIISSYFPESEIYFFDSARNALGFLLKILKKETPGFVFNQAFTCLVVPHAIKSAGWKPIYIDIDESYNLDFKDLKNKFSALKRSFKNSPNHIQIHQARNKSIEPTSQFVLIIQNTFGLPAKVKELLSFAQENNILVIENLVHSLGAKYEEKYLGNFGDFALLSFNRNKVISSIIGGALIVNNKNFSETIKKEYEKLKEYTEIKKVVRTGLLLYQLRENYNFFYKKILGLTRKLKLTLEMISKPEKEAKSINNFLKYPELLFPLLLNQLKKLEKFNQHRQEIARIINEKFPLNYPQESKPIFLRYPILIESRDEIYQKFKKLNIYLGDWYFCILMPCCDLKKFDYQTGTCPRAENLSQKIINLPTYPSLKTEDINFILAKIKKWL